MNTQLRPRIIFAPEAAKFADDNKLNLDDIEEWLLDSAIVSHPDGNRRYEDYIFRVKGSEVLSMGFYQPERVSLFKPDDGTFVMEEECPSCHDAPSTVGCLECGGKGTISVRHKSV